MRAYSREAVLRAARHRRERVVDQVGRLLEDRELGAVVEELAHDGERREAAMRAMVLTAARAPLEEVELPDPEPGPGQALLRVLACGVCRTDLHVVDGELTRPKLPLVPGHEIVAEVVASAGRFSPGDRVGVPWLGWTCGECPYCLAGRENLCDRARFTGYDLDGGYAELCVADERFCFAVPAAVRRPRGGAASLRRADRLPIAPARGRRSTGRALRVRRGGAHRLPGRAPPGTRGLRADAPGGRRTPRHSHDRSARPGRETPRRGRRSSSTPRSSSPPPASSSRRHSATCARAGSSSAPVST